MGSRASTPARTSWPALIGALVKGESLSADEAAWAMNEIMEGAATDAQISGFAVALRMKGETATEVAGLARTMLDHATPIHVPGRLVDLVGTGADGAHTVNISTMATIVAAAAGARMVKHGNRAASSKCGAADVLEALGVVIDLPPAATAELAAETGVAFLFAPLYHPALRHAGPTRSQLGVPTVFNFLGPVANPARPQVQAVGVADRRMGGVLAGVLAARGCSALVFHGHDGLDELTTTTSSSVWLTGGAAVSAGPGGDSSVPQDGVSRPRRTPDSASYPESPSPKGGEDVRETEFDPAALGFARARLEDLRGGDAAYNAAVARAVLGGEAGPVRDVVLLNAAAALAADSGIPRPEDLEKALSAGCSRAAEAIDSGAARALLDRWAAASRRLAPSAP